MVYLNRPLRGNFQKIFGKGSEVIIFVQSKVIKMLYIPTLQVTPYHSIAYYKPEKSYKKNKSLLNPIQKENLRKNYKSKDITKGSIKRLKRAIGNLVAISPVQKIVNPVIKREQKFRLTFITLTLSAPQGSITDHEITNLILKPFLKEMRRRKWFDSYIWKAEKQENGNIHYHITTNKFLHYSNLKYIWNKFQNKLGYVDEFEKKHGHRQPNSTDIHATYNIRNLQNYLVKYLTKKNKAGLEVTSKKWDCSTNLKRKESCEIEICKEIRKATWTLERAYPDLTFIRDRFTIYKHTKESEKIIFSRYVKEKFNEFKEIIRMTNKQYKIYKEYIKNEFNNITSQIKKVTMQTLQSIMPRQKDINQHLRDIDLNLPHVKGFIHHIQYRYNKSDTNATFSYTSTKTKEFIRKIAGLILSPEITITAIKSVPMPKVSPNQLRLEI